MAKYDWLLTDEELIKAWNPYSAKPVLEAQLDKTLVHFLAWLEKHGSQVQVDLFKEETGL